MSRWVHVVLAACLVMEGASTGLSITSQLSLIRAYDVIVLGVIAVRGLIGALQLTAGSLLWKQSPAGHALAPFVFLASALMYALELGVGLRPSSVYPGAQWLLVGAYAVYAAVAVVVLVRFRPRE